MLSYVKHLCMYICGWWLYFNLATTSTICVSRCSKSASADRIFFRTSMHPCMHKKVRPQYIWTRRKVSSIVFPLFHVMLVTMSFTILSLTNFIENSNNIYDIKDHTNLNSLGWKTGTRWGFSTGIAPQSGTSDVGSVWPNGFWFSRSP